MIEVVIICENVLEADRMVFLIFEAVLLRIAASEGLRKFDSEMLDVDIQADRTPFASPRGIIVMLATSAAVLAIFLVHQLILANAAASQLNRLRFQSERLHLTLERTTAVAQQADRKFGCIACPGIRQSITVRGKLFIRAESRPNKSGNQQRLRRQQRQHQTKPS